MGLELMEIIVKSDIDHEVSSHEASSFYFFESLMCVAKMFVKQNEAVYTVFTLSP